MFSDIAPIASYWDQPDRPGRTASDPQPWRDPYDAEPEAQETDEAEVESPATMPYRPVVDPWSSAGGRLGAAPGSRDAFVAPVIRSMARRGNGGPPAWFLGLAGFMLILGVAAAAVVFVIRPLISDQIESATGDAIVTAVSRATVAPDVATGMIVVDEQAINRSIRASQDDFRPVEDLRVQIRRSGIEATFSVYGVPATLTGTVKVRNGRITIVNPHLNGSVGRMISVDRIAADAERAINDLLRQNNLRPTAVTLSDDTLTIKTAPIG
jgi:hypothetical protein